MIYDGIKLDDKSAITIAKVTGSISSEQQELLKFSEHKIQIIQSEPVSEPIGTQNDQNENENGDSCQSPDTEEKPDSSNSITSDTSAAEQTENDKAEITPSESPSEDDNMQSVPESTKDRETPDSSDNEGSEDSTIQPTVDTSDSEGFHTEEVNETPEAILSDEQLPETDPPSEISESHIDEGIDTSLDQTLPDNTLANENPGEIKDIIQDSVPSTDSHSQTDTETDKSDQEKNNNDYFKSGDNHFNGKKYDNYQAGYNDSSQEEKTGRKSHLSIIGVLIILVSLLVICFLLSRQKTNDQSTLNENKSEETTMNTSTPALISTDQSTAEEGLSTSSGEFITPTVLSLSSEENDNSDSAILTSPLTPTETVKPAIVFTPSVMFATVTNNPAPSISPVIPSSTLKPTSTRTMDTPTATEELIIPTETSSETPVATETSVTPSATPSATNTKVVPSETQTATEMKAKPTATITLTIAPSETSTPQQSDPYAEVIITEEEKPSPASIQGAGTYFYQKPYQSQEFVLRWLNNGTEVEILSGPVIRNNAEWYEVFAEQYGQTGWIISSAVSDNLE